MAMRMIFRSRWREEVRSRLAHIETMLGQVLKLQAQEASKMSQMDDAIAKLQADVAALTAVDQSAITLINGFAAQLAAAVAAAQAAGATPAQLQALSDLSAAIEAQDTALQAAVTANTPAAPPASP